MTNREWTGLLCPQSLHPHLVACFPQRTVCGKKPLSTASGLLSRATGVSLAMNPPWSFLGRVLENVSGSLPLWAGISLPRVCSQALGMEPVAAAGASY